MTTQQAPADLPFERLEQEVAAIGGLLARRMARWLELVAEFDRRGGATQRGFRSTSEWLAWLCGLDARTAREHVRVARRLDELPETRQALATGEVSYSKVRALTRAAPTESETALLALARRTTADRLEQAVRSLSSSPSADPETAARVHDGRYLDVWWDGDGALNVHGRLPADDGAAFVEAIDTAAEAIGGRDRDGAGEATARPPRPARRADALAELVHSGCPRTHVVLHVDPRSLTAPPDSAPEPAAGVCALHDGPAVPVEMARRLACDAEVALSGTAAGWTGGDGPVLDHGRARRVVSPALRASLERRDERCRFPACDRRHGLHAHHITHWAHGGPTDRDNLVLLCRFHHRLVHEGGFTTEVREGELVFSRPDGQRMTSVPPPPTAVGV